jgi:cell division protein FtsZ
VIKNDRARESFSFNSTPFALGLVDTIVCRIVQTVQTLMTNRDTVELEDLKMIMQYRGIGLIGIAQGNRKDEAREIIENAIKSPLFDGASIKNAKGIMIHWRINSNTSPCGITEVMGNINEIIGTNAKTIFKLTNDNTLAVEEVRVTIIATGFESLENE